MSKLSINALKQLFKTGLKPVQADFWNWLDSFWHKDEKIPLSSLDGLQDEFDKKADKSLVDSLFSSPINSVTVNEYGHLIFVMSNGDIIDCGLVKQPDGTFMTVAEFVTTGGGGKVLAALNADKLGGQTKAQIIEQLNSLYASITHVHSYTTLTDKPNIPIIDPDTVIDANYVHTQENYTTAEKEKLAGLESSHYKGRYTTIAALNTAYPTAIAGDYARVDAGVGVDVITYIWDDSDLVWVQEKGTGTTETASSIKTKYESNADTNAFTDNLKAKLIAFTANFTSELKTAYDSAVTHISDSSKHLTTALVNYWNAKWGSDNHPSTVAGYGITDIPTNADTVDNFHVWSGSQAAYDAIVTKSSTTIYLIV